MAWLFRAISPVFHPLATVLEALRGLHGVAQRFYSVKIFKQDLACCDHWVLAPCHAFHLSLGILWRWHRDEQVKQIWHRAPCTTMVLLRWRQCCGTPAPRCPRAACCLGPYLILAEPGDILLQCFRLTIVSGSMEEDCGVFRRFFCVPLLRLHCCLSSGRAGIFLLPCMSGPFL